jgi:AcrR family transcriptional regulator
MSPASPTRTSAGSELEELLAAPLGLRERKKLKTRRAIRVAAFRLFAEQGYDATTVDQIAAESEVSPSTFFRYFATKEDLVLSDDYDPLMEAAFRARPKDEPLVESLRQAMIGPLRQILATERDEMLQRMRLYREVPAIRARAMLGQKESVQMMCGLLAERTGDAPDSLRLRAIVSAILAASEEAVLYWAEQDGQGDMTELLSDAITALVDAFGR